MENLFSSKSGTRKFFAAGGVALACLSLRLVSGQGGLATPLQAHA